VCRAQAASNNMSDKQVKVRVIEMARRSRWQTVLKSETVTVAESVAQESEGSG
jgi:uncharacterized protein (DUF39 family)